MTQTFEFTQLQIAAPAEVDPIAAKIAELEAKIKALQETPVTGSTTATQNAAVKKNQKPGKPTAGRKYVLLDQQLKSWGKVPQQQQDIARILSTNFEVGKEYTEAEVFETLTKEGNKFESIRTSVQDPTYLFRYYRGLKNDGKHAGFVARNFVKQIG